MKGKRHNEIFETLKSEILSGKYSGSSHFPSDNALARRFKAGRPTVYWAVSRLSDMGFVWRKRGAGTFLTKEAMRNGGPIAVIAPSFPSSEIFPVICKELSLICQEKGRLFCYADDHPGSAKDALSRLKSSVRRMSEQGVAGVIFRPVDYYENSAEINFEITSAIRKAGIPLVLLDCEIGEPDVSSGFDVVGIDNMVTGMRLGRHIAECGAKRVLFLSRARSSVNVRLRQIGIKAALNDMRGTRMVCLRMPDVGFPDLSAQIRKLKPEAILCSGDIVAAHVLKILAKMRLNVPDDVLVAGVDDVEIARMTTPPLTTVRQPCAEIARAAFEMLMWRTAHLAAVPRRVALAADLVVRESTKRGFHQKKLNTKTTKAKEQ